MSDDQNISYYGEKDDDGYMRIHHYDLRQLLKNANASFTMLSDINALVKELRKADNEIKDLQAELNEFQRQYKKLKAVRDGE